MERDADRIYRSLRQQLIGGNYPPGAHLREEPIAQEYGLSRTPVRAALRRLVEEGLAVAGAGQGIRVAVWNAHDIEEVYQIRILLEPHAARLTAQRGREDVPAQLRATHERMVALIQKEGPDELTEIEEENQRFHRLIIDNAGSPRLRAMLDTIIDVPKIIGSFQIYTHVEIEKSFHYHHDLIKAIESRDGDLAFHVMQLHLKIAYMRYMRHQSDQKIRQE